MNRRITYLLKKFEADSLSKEEKDELLKFTELESSATRAAIEEMLNEETAHFYEQSYAQSSKDWEPVLKKVLEVDKISLPKRKLLPLIMKWAVAASIIIVTYLSIFHPTKPNENSFIASIDQHSKPGSNKAKLILDNGKELNLDELEPGQLELMTGISVSKTKDGQLIYTTDTSNNNLITNKTNTIITPTGGQWQVILADGSKVWLNSNSSITYPLCFKNLKNRTVEINGEAYFEVTSNKNQPFIVKTGIQSLEVLGTSFNVKNYPEEKSILTTLLEGSIRIVKKGSEYPTVLKPGQQSSLTENGILIRNIDAEEAIDWKSGYFMFSNEKQESIMLKLSRWYGFEFEFADQSAKDITYFGMVNRFDNLSTILRKFEQTGKVRFELKNKKVIIYQDEK